MQGASEENGRFRTFDFLRGLAILGVICVHSVQSFPSNIGFIDFAFSIGRFGVQMFFFVSAITMCYMWKRREGEANPVQKFYLRRLFRIAPFFWLAIPIYLIVNGLDGIETKHVILTALFLHGLLPESISSVVPGGWSIAVEMTFYVFFPFLMTNVKENRKLYIYLGAIIWMFNTFIFKKLVMEAFAVNADNIQTAIVHDYLALNFINQSPIFLLGCYLYFVLNNKPKFGEIAFLCLWVLFGGGLRLMYGISGVGFLMQYMAIGVIVFICTKVNVRSKVIESLGRNSYAIYLTHFLVLHYLQKLAPMRVGLTALLLGTAVTTLISYFLSKISYRLIEAKSQQLVVHLTHTV